MMVCQTRKGLTFGAGKRSGQQFFLLKTKIFACGAVLQSTLHSDTSSVSFFCIYVGSYIDQVDIQAINSNHHTLHSLISDPGRQLIFGQMVLWVALIREYITLNKN